MMGFKFSDPSFISWGVLDREPVGVNLAGKETNFNVHRCKDRIAPHKKLTVWHVLSGGLWPGGRPHQKSVPFDDKIVLCKSYFKETLKHNEFGVI